MQTVVKYGILSIGLYLSTAVHAQEANRRAFSIKLYSGYSVSNETSFLHQVGGHFQLDNSPVTGFGMAWFLTSNWSAEVSASASRYRVNMTGGDYSSMQILRDEIPLGNVMLVPVSLSIKYHINRWERIRPYLAVGRTFLLFDDQHSGWAVDAVEYHSRAGLLFGMGIDYYLTNRWFLQLDGKHFLANRAEVNADLTKSVGWKLNGQLKPDPTHLTLAIGYRF